MRAAGGQCGFGIEHSATLKSHSRSSLWYVPQLLLDDKSFWFHACQVVAPSGFRATCHLVGIGVHTYCNNVRQTKSQKLNLAVNETKAEIKMWALNTHFSFFSKPPIPVSKPWLVYICLSMYDNVSLSIAYMCCEAFGKNSAYCGAESSGPWGAAWLTTIITGRCGYIFLDMRKKLMLSLVIRSVK